MRDRPPLEQVGAPDPVNAIPISEAPPVVEILPPIERLQVVDLLPGDYLIATVAEDTSPEQADALGGDLRERFPDQHVLVVSGVQLDAMRPPSQGAE